MKTEFEVYTDILEYVRGLQNEMDPEGAPYLSDWEEGNYTGRKDLLEDIYNDLCKKQFEVTNV